MKLNGKPTYRGKGFVLLEVGGCGWKVVFPEQVLIPLFEEITVYTHEQWRETEHELYGFLSLEALELFWRLLGVSGVGAKSAQKIVFQGTVHDVHHALGEGNVDFFQSISGIGKKTAQKIVLELKGILAESSTDEADLLAALQGLGYKPQDVREIVRQTSGTVEERLRATLQALKR